MNEDSFDIFTLAKENLSTMKNRIDEAFVQKRKVSVSPEGLIEEMINEYKQLHAKIDGKSDDEIIDCGQYEKKPGEVTVEHSHEYFALLKLAVQTVRPEWMDDEIYVNAEASEIFEHEMDHAAPEAGHPESNILYGVHFYEDAKTGEINFFPFVRFEGKTTVGRLRDSLTNVKNPSVGDNVILSGK